MGDIPCVIKTLKSDEIRQYYDKKQYPQAFYLLAMVDYLSREHRLPLYNAYNDMRKQKLADPIYPQSILALAKVMEDDSILSDSLEKAIPEFRRFTSNRGVSRKLRLMTCLPAGMRHICWRASGCVTRSIAGSRQKQRNCRLSGEKGEAT